MKYHCLSQPVRHFGHFHRSFLFCSGLLLGVSQVYLYLTERTLLLLSVVVLAGSAVCAFEWVHHGEKEGGDN